jgi:fumarate hydratase class II
MKSQANEIKQIAAQLLAGMLANPHTYQVYPTGSGKLSKEQQTELIELAIALAESLVSKTETRIEEHLKHDFLWEEGNDELSA